MRDKHLENLGGVQMVAQAAKANRESVIDRFVKKVRTALIHGEDDILSEIVAVATGKGSRWLAPDGRTMPVIAGGDTTNPVSHPLGPPTINGNNITVDMMLKQPTRITRMLMDLTLQRFVIDRIFTNAGGVTGGAVVYDQATVNELYLDREVERVAPGQEFPVVTSERRAPKIAEVEKWGGKFYFTDEARDRNDAAAFVNETRRLANTIVRKMNARAIEVLEAAIAGNAGQSEMVGNDWSAAIPNGSNPTPPASTPGADLADVQLAGDIDELGIQYNILLVNPVQRNEWRLFYGNNSEAALRDFGFNEMYATNRVPLGTAYAIASGQLGEMRVEQPLQTVTEREGAPLLRERTWVQSSVRPVMFVTNPFAVIKLTGL